MTVGTGPLDPPRPADLSSDGDAVVPRPVTEESGRPRVVWLASIAFLGVLPALVVVLLFRDAMRADGLPYDFRVFYVAAEALLRGDSIFPVVDDSTLSNGRGYVYPPFVAVVFTPLTAMSTEVAGVLFMAVLVLAALAVPLVAGVRDWRCFGILLLWPPVISDVQLGAVSTLLALAAALVWRFRRTPQTAGAALGAALTAKILLWPLGAWLAATRRLSALACLALEAIRGRLRDEGAYARAGVPPQMDAV